MPGAGARTVVRASSWSSSATSRRRASARARCSRSSAASLRLAEQGLLLGGQGADGVHHRHLVVQLRVAQGHGGLIRQDRGDFALGLVGEVRLGGFERQHAEDALFVP
jgi:hypothetical protein